MASVNLLYPELLSTETLLQVLLERRVKVEGIENMTRDRLLEIFIQYCLPYAQRKCKRMGHNQNNVFKNNESIVGNVNGLPSELNKNINIEENDQIECSLHMRKKQKLEETNITSDTVNINGATNIYKRKTSYLETSEVLDVPSKKQKMHIGWSPN